MGRSDPSRGHGLLGAADMGQGIPHPMHDPNAIDVLRLVISVPFAGAGPATKRQRRDAKCPRGKG
jgi:hypothetical protein